MSSGIESAIPMAKEEGQVLVELANLESSFEFLRATVRRAEAGLAQVLNPGSSGQGEPPGNPTPTVSPLADRLATVNHQICSLSSEVQEWINRIEL